MMSTSTKRTIPRSEQTLLATSRAHLSSSCTHTVLSRTNPTHRLDGQEITLTQHPNQTPILATSSGRPNRRLLQALKRVARRLELNCGRCERCKSKYHECAEFTLHRFRRTVLTALLRSGVDLRTVQSLAGHKDVASTMRYLRPAAGSEVRDKINAVKW
jgi:integrase